MLFLLTLAFADSPITSIDLSVGFQDSAAVRLARSNDGSTRAVMDFLLSDATLAERVAVVDALGWGNTPHAPVYAEALAARRRQPLSALRLTDLRPEERVILAYLLAHDDYHELAPLKLGSAHDLLGADPRRLAASGAEALSSDFAAQAVRTLIDAQAQMSISWCEVWTPWQALLDRTPESRRNLPKASVQAATDYLRGYGDECPKAPDPKNPQLDEVYTLAALGDRLFSGTQGGLVVWRNGRVESTLEDKICNSLAVVDDAVYAGCYHRLLRWQGGNWTEVDADATVREGGSYLVWTDPEGALRVQHGGQELRLQNGAWTRLGAAPGYDRLYASDGTVWHIDFMSAVVRGDERMPIQGERYPSRDPRSFYEDPQGRVWVADFGSGLLRWQDGRFQPVPGLSNKGSAVGVAADGTVWMLHYTDGPTVRRPDGRLQVIDLSEQENMRDLLLSPHGAWVAGWHGIVELTASGDGWSKRVLRVSSPAGKGD